MKGIIIVLDVVMVGVEVVGRIRVRSVGGGACCCGGGIGGVRGTIKQGTVGSHVGPGTASDERTGPGACGRPGTIATKVRRDLIVIAAAAAPAGIGLGHHWAICSVLQPGDRWPCGHRHCRERKRRGVEQETIITVSIILQKVSE